MRCVDRKTFLALPAGTIYAKGIRWAFRGIAIKGDSLGNDWVECDPAWVSADSSTVAFDRLEEMLATGASYPSERHGGRDGLYADDAIFLVFEADDLHWLRGEIDAALALPSA